MFTRVSQENKVGGDEGQRDRYTHSNLLTYPQRIRKITNQEDHSCLLFIH